MTQGMLVKVGWLPRNLIRQHYLKQFTAVWLQGLTQCFRLLKFLIFLSMCHSWKTRIDSMWISPAGYRGISWKEFYDEEPNLKNGKSRNFLVLFLCPYFLLSILKNFPLWRHSLYIFSPFVYIVEVNLLIYKEEK